MAEGQSNTLRFLTWNVNGLETALKKKKVETALEKKKVETALEKKTFCEVIQVADVVFLQETHIKKDEGKPFSKKYPDFWNYWWEYHTEYDRGERGVAILINKRIPIENEVHCIDPLRSAFIVLHCCLNGQQYTLVNVYHHKKDKKTLTLLSEYLQRHTTGRLVIGGDFNTVFCRLMDKKVPTANSDHSNAMKRLEPLMKSLQLVDVWRWRYPYWCFHTFKRGEVASRLDYFFVQEELLLYVQTCEILNVSDTDHLPVSLHLDNGGGRQRQNNDSTGSSPPPCREPGCTEICRLISQNSKTLEILFKYKSDVTLQKNTKPVYKRVTTHDIAKAINRLQVSETERQDKIQVSKYKENLTKSHLLEHLEILYSNILDGETVPEFSFAISIGPIFHIFNVDYIILASILARRLNKELKSLTGRHTKPDEEKPAAWIYCFQKVPESVDQKVLEKALATLSLSKDVLAFCRIHLNSQKYRLRQGCPLTSSLHRVLLTYAAVEDLKKHVSTEDQGRKRFKTHDSTKSLEWQVSTEDSGLIGLKRHAPTRDQDPIKLKKQVSTEDPALNSLKKQVKIYVYEYSTLCVLLKDLKKQFEENIHTSNVPQIIKESNCLNVMKSVPVSVLHAKEHYPT